MEPFAEVRRYREQPVNGKQVAGSREEELEDAAPQSAVSRLILTVAGHAAPATGVRWLPGESIRRAGSVSTVPLRGGFTAGCSEQAAPIGEIRRGS